MKTQKKTNLGFRNSLQYGSLSCRNAQWSIEVTLSLQSQLFPRLLQALATIPLDLLSKLWDDL